MKLRLPFFFALLVVSTVVRLAGQAAPVPAPDTGPKDDATELESKMDKLNSAFRKLKRQVADPAANASSLELVAIIRKASQESLALIPAKAADLPASKRDEFVAAYRAKMKLFEEQVVKLERALTAGKNAEAVNLVAEMGSSQKEGHKEFKRPKKDA